MLTQQENFEEDLISEKVAIASIPYMHTTREKSRDSSSGSGKMHTHRQLPHADIQKLLYGDRPPKRLATSANHKRREELLDRQLKEREFKLRQKHTEEQERQLRDCTFRPRINQSQNGQKRTLKQFLQSQQNFSKKVNEKKEQMKHMLEETKKQELGKFKPKRAVKGEGEREQIFERLYRQRVGKENDVPMIAECDFTPQITARGRNVVRDKPVAEHLYYDAMRRQEVKDKCMLNSKVQQERPPNLLNEKYAAQKFIKDYYSVLEELQLTEGLRPLSIDEFLDVLQKTGFLTETAFESKSGEWNLANEAYGFLKQTSPNIRNLCVFLMALVGIYHINPVNFDAGENEQPSPELNLDVVEGRKLQKHYGLLYRNRLFAQSLRKTDLTQTYSFKPQINPQSQHLAETFRSKMLEQTTVLLQNHQIVADLPKDGMITHVELLQLSKLGKQAELKKRRQQNELDQMKECTFKPVIGDNSRRSVNMSTDSFNNTTKFEELYNLSKNMKRMEKTKSELDFERCEKDCTFAPKINKKVLGTVRAEIFAKDIDKTIVRMVQGRKQREAKNRMLARDNPQTNAKAAPKKPRSNNISNTFAEQHIENSKETSAKLMRSDPTQQHLPSSFQESRNGTFPSNIVEQVPFLVIDVNLGDEVEQIVVYKDQADKPEVLAEGFAEKHGLDGHSKAKLVELLRIEINSILQKIDEEEEQQDSQN